MDWDDIRFFLAVGRRDSIRGAAGALGVTHATVLRRIARLEQKLDARLFDKLPTGYLMTAAGAEILAEAEQMEARADALQRRVYGRDAALTGALRVTLPQVLAADLVMPDLTEFARENPGIALEVTTSYEALNLTKRQADVAIRLVYPNESPPEHLYGRKLSGVHRAAYTARGMEAGTASNWVLKEEDGPAPKWARDLLPDAGMDYVVSDVIVQQAAVREGLGAAVLLCFAGESDPGLARIAPALSHHYGDLWILTHGDLRQTPRVRAFTEFFAERLRNRIDLFEGRCMSCPAATDRG